MLVIILIYPQYLPRKIQPSLLFMNVYQALSAYWPTGPPQRRRSLGNFLRGLLTVQSSRSKAMPIGRQYNYWPRRMPRYVSPIIRGSHMCWPHVAFEVRSELPLALPADTRDLTPCPVKRERERDPPPPPRKRLAGRSAYRVAGSRLLKF